MATVQELQLKAVAIQQKYRALNASSGQAAWTVSDYASGLVGDVGDLVKLIMAHSGLRSTDNVDEKLRHELSDVLWSVLIIASELGIDVEKSFSETMSELDARIDEDLK